MPTQPGDLPIDSSQVGGTELAQRLNRILPDVVTNSAAIEHHKTDPNPHPQYMLAGVEKANRDGSNATGTWGINITGRAANLTENPTHYTHIGAWAQAADAPNTFLVNRAYMSDMCTGNAATSSSCSGNAATATVAASCSGNAATASWASGANTAVHLSGSTNSHIVYASDNQVTCHIWAEAPVARFGFLNAAGNAVLYADQGGNTIAVGNITAYSDIRLKKDFEVIGGALDKVQQLTGYTFTRIDSGERQAGLIAQDVQKVLPELVKSEKGMKEDDPDTLVLAYGNMAGLFVEAIKELRAEVIALRAEVAELRGA